MSNGKLSMNTAEAKAKAETMKQIALEMEELLNNVSIKMQDINSDNSDTYKGNKKPAQLRAELDDFRKMFGLVHQQINKSAEDIIKTANTMESE